jgi:biopolymer transport protein TolQ
MTLIAAAASTGIVAPSHLDPMQLFLDADIVVQVVMTGLILASIWVWTIVVSFSMRMGKVRRRSAAFEQDFWDAEQPEALVQGKRRQDNPSARIAAAGLA